MADLVGEPARLRQTITIERAATGQIETYDLTWIAGPPPQEHEAGEGADGGKPHGRDT